MCRSGYIDEIVTQHGRKGGILLAAWLVGDIESAKVDTFFPSHNPHHNHVGKAIDAKEI